MYYQTAVSAALLAFASHASALRRCGDVQPSLEFVQHSAAIGHDSQLASTPLTVRYYVHVVTTAAKKGAYPESMVSAQVKVMQDVFKKYNINLIYQALDYTVNDDWAVTRYDTPADLAMKTALRRGGYADLNHYYLSDIDKFGGDGLLGQCYFPNPSAPSNSTIVTLDGCILGAETMPNGTAAPFNQGITAVHETGHWFGLYHPFQDHNCSAPGDLIADTPAQKTPSSGCPIGKDTCPGRPGHDDYHNYMDYADDYCNTHFTSQQNTRALNMYAMYRASNASRS